MEKLIGFLLIVTLTVGAAGPALAAGAEQPFGQELVPLSREELEEVDGEFKVALAVAALGATSGAIQYLVETPYEEWSFGAMAASAASKAVDTVFGFVVGRLTAP